MHKSYKTRTTKGFTLIELSIVLVIISLIVGGVIGGKSLIESAKVQAQVKQLISYKVAYNSFKLQYDAIPGDFNEAWSYWGTSCANSQANCNGDGNNIITTSADYAWHNYSENLMFFNHLGQADLLPKKYTGIFTFNDGFPALEINNTDGMTAGGYIDSHADAPAAHQLSNTNQPYTAMLFLQVSRPSEIGRFFNDYDGTLTVKQAKQIDTKMDDGIARKGDFMAYRANNGGNNGGNCLTGADGDYLVSNTGDACLGQYILEK